MVHSHPPPGYAEQEGNVPEVHQEPASNTSHENNSARTSQSEPDQGDHDHGTQTHHQPAGIRTPEKDYSDDNDDDDDEASLTDLVASNIPPEEKVPPPQLIPENPGPVGVIPKESTGCHVKQVPANSTPGPVSGTVTCDNSGCTFHQNHDASTHIVPLNTPAAPTGAQPAFPPAALRMHPPTASPVAADVVPVAAPAFAAPPPRFQPQPVADYASTARPNVAPPPPWSVSSRPVPVPAEPVLQPPPQQPQSKSKVFGNLFRKGKAKNADPPQLAQSGVPPASVAPVLAAPGGHTVVYDPKSSVNKQPPPQPKPDKKAGKSKPGKGVQKHTPQAYPPPGPYPGACGPCGQRPYPPGGVPTPQEGADLPPAIPPRQVFHPPGSFQPPPPGSRDGTLTPLSMTSMTSQLSTVGPIGFGVGYLDIIPNPGDNFADLMKHANDWLNGAHTFKAISFESLSVPYDSQCNLNTEDPLYDADGDLQYGCVLRMWVTPKKAEEPPAPQRVSYVCLFPKWQGVKRGSRPTMPDCETLDDTLARCNADFAGSSPLKGRVISMETVSHLHAFHKDGTPIHLDPEACCWTDSCRQDVNILSMVRIYYSEDPESTPEVIGVQDFVPECKEDGDMTTLETSDVLMDTAASWVKKFPGLRVNNLQTMVRFGDDADDHLATRKMVQKRRAQNACFSRFLRVYFSQKVDSSPAEGPLEETPASLFYKDFVPVVRSTSEGRVKRVEKSGELMQKLVAWYCLSGHDVICVETVPIYGRDKLRFDPEENFTCLSASDGPHHRLFTFRVYTDATPDDAASDSDSVHGSVKQSPTGSVTSHDFSAWPFASVPSGYTVHK